MIQFNLLPDIKIVYIRAQRLKRLVISVSVLATAVSLAIFLILFSYVELVQREQLNHLDTNISKDSAAIAQHANLNKILTIQNQLATLPQLEASAPAASRLFDYLSELTPSQATISNLQIDFTQNTLVITGDADSLATVNQYIDTMKFTTYTAANEKNASAFSDVVLSSFSYNKDSAADNVVNYTINLNFDPNIFNNADQVKLTTPDITSTRSILDQPTDLFKADSSTEKQ